MLERSLLSKIARTAIGAYIAAIASSLMILVWVMKLWDANLYVPLSYVGDSIFTAALIKGLIDNGWYLYNPFLGAPYGLYMYDFPLSNNLDFIVLRLISLIIRDYAFTMNLYFLLTFPLTTLTSMLVLRQLKVSYASSILGSLLYTFLSYHFWRGEGHLFLAAYYMIPLMVMVLFWVYSDKNLLLYEVGGGIQANVFNQKTLMSIIICLIISSTFIYYPFFSCFFLIVTGVTASLRHRSKTPLITSLLFVVLITAGVLINVSPTLIYQHENGNNPAIAIRTPEEAEYYGLKMTQLLMPISRHSVFLLAGAAKKYTMSRNRHQ